MKPTKRWQKSILDTAGNANLKLPWSERNSRIAWRARCGKRVNSQSRAA